MAGVEEHRVVTLARGSAVLYESIRYHTLLCSYCSILCYHILHVMCDCKIVALLGHSRLEAPSGPALDLGICQTLT